MYRATPSAATKVTARLKSDGVGDAVKAAAKDNMSDNNKGSTDSSGSQLALPGPGQTSVSSRRAAAEQKLADAAIGLKLYPNSSNYQRYNPTGHSNNPTPHGHGHLMGNGPGRRGQGASIDVSGNVVSFNSPDAHWALL